MQVELSCYSGAAFGPKTPPFLVDKLESFLQVISNEVSDCIPNIESICSHVFEFGGLQVLGSSQFLQDLKGHRFLDMCAKYFV